MLDGPHGLARDQVVAHRQHHLGADQHAAVGRELVEGLVDRALDRVLDRHQGLRHLALAHGAEAVDHRRVGHLLERGAGPARREQRLLAERAGRPEVAGPHPSPPSGARSIGISPVVSSGAAGSTGSPAGSGRPGAPRGAGGRTGRPVARATARLLLGRQALARACPPPAPSGRSGRGRGRAGSVTTAPVPLPSMQRDRPRLAAAHVAVGVVAHHALEAQRGGAGCASVTSPWRSTRLWRSLRPCSRRVHGALQARLAVDEAGRGSVGQQHLLRRAQPPEPDPEGHAGAERHDGSGARGDRDQERALHQIVILTGYSAVLLSVRVSPVTGTTSITSVPWSPNTTLSDAGPGISTVVVVAGGDRRDLDLALVDVVRGGRVRERRLHDARSSRRSRRRSSRSRST